MSIPAASLTRRTVFHVNLPPPENVPPGWYQDPYQPGQLRWWDGGAWGTATQPLPAAPTHQTPSDVDASPSYVVPAARPASPPGAVQTPASKNVAITLWSLAGLVAGRIVLAGLGHPDGAWTGIVISLFTISITSGLLAIPGYIAWMLYKSATSRPLRGLTIAKRASAAVLALLVSAFMLALVATEVESADSGIGWAMFVLFFPIFISLVVTVLLYIADVVPKSSSSRK